MTRLKRQHLQRLSYWMLEARGADDAHDHDPDYHDDHDGHDHDDRDEFDDHDHGQNLVVDDDDQVHCNAKQPALLPGHQV